MEVEGNGFVIRNSRFLFNGYESGAGSGGEPWADGLTVWNCYNGQIHDNEFIDNTDVALILGGGSNCIVERNTITQQNAYAFAGLMVWNFHGGEGNHAGSTYGPTNTVTSGFNRLTYGLMIGSHPWDIEIPVPHAGRVLGNSADGAVNNLTVDGIAAGEVQGNGFGLSQGNKQFPASCGLPGAAYTAADFGGAGLQGGWIFRFYHPNGCGS